MLFKYLIPGQVKFQKINLINIVMHQSRNSKFCQKEKYLYLFPKGIGNKYKTFNEVVKPNGINLDYDIDLCGQKTTLKMSCCKEV